MNGRRSKRFRLPWSIEADEPAFDSAGFVAACLVPPVVDGFGDDPDDEDATDEARVKKRYELIWAVRELSAVEKIRNCGTPLGDVLDTRKRLPSGKFAIGCTGDIARCQSVGCCVFCSAPERHTRATELDRHCTALLKSNHTLMFGVFTLSDRSMPLAESTEMVKAMWRKFWDNDKFTAALARLCYVGNVRAFEWTIRYDLTGHPHIQTVIACKGVLSGQAFDELEVLMRRRWLTVTGMAPARLSPEQAGLCAEQGLHVERLQVPLADAVIGFRSERVGLDENGKCSALSKYMTKGAESWTLGSEMMRSDLKSSRSEITFAPFDIARYFVETGDVQARWMWQAYERVAAGVHVTKYARGFRAYCEAVCATLSSTEPAPTVMAPTTAVEADPAVDADGEVVEDQEYVAEGHIGFVWRERDTARWMRRHRLEALYTVKLARFPDGVDPVPILREWLYDLGASLAIAEGFYSLERGSG